MGGLASEWAEGRVGGGEARREEGVQGGKGRKEREGRRRRRTRQRRRRRRGAE